MNASGYADLLAKSVAGADWILADAAGEEPIEPATWATVQDSLRRGSLARRGRPRRSGLPAATRCRTVDERFRDATRDRAALPQGPSISSVTFGTCSTIPITGRPIPRFQGRYRDPGVARTVRGLLRRDLERLDVDDAVASWPSMSVPRSGSSPCLVPANWLPRHWRRPGRSTPHRGHSCATRSPSRRMAQSPRAADHGTCCRSETPARCFERRAAHPSRNRSGYPAIAFGCRTSKPTSSGGGLRSLDLAMRMRVFESALDELFGPKGRGSTAANCHYGSQT